MTLMLNLLSENRDRLPMFAIYDHPRDFPDHFVARLWWSIPEAKPTNFTVRSDDLDTIRDMMQGLGLVKLMRSPGDDATIMEVWL